MKDIDKIFKMLIPEEDIDALLKELRNPKKEKSIIYLKPSEIEKIKNFKKRQETMHRYKLVNELFILPLEELLNVIQEKDKRVNSLSIKNKDLNFVSKINRIYKVLEESGYSSHKLIEFVPRSVEEIEILILAKRLGYIPSEKILTNEEKVLEALSYLESKDIIKKEKNYKLQI